MLHQRAFPVLTRQALTLPRHSATCSALDPRPPAFLSRVAHVRRAGLAAILVSAACAEGVPPALLDALVAHESHYDPSALSGHGAIGLAQLMPATARALGITNPWDVRQNLQGGARYLRQQLDTFGRYDLALAAYNAGPGQVIRYNGVPPFAETRAYIGKVLATMLSSSAHLARMAEPPKADQNKIHNNAPGRTARVHVFRAVTP